MIKSVSTTALLEKPSPQLDYLLHSNLVTPTKKAQEKIVKTISTLKLEDCELFYSELRKRKLFKQPYPLQNNRLRRKKRTKHYIQTIKKITEPFVQSIVAKSKFCDLGCGSGVITVGVLNAYLKKGGKIYGCDVTNYIDSSLKKYITFTKSDFSPYLKRVQNDYFDGIMEIVMLHHLSSKTKFVLCLKEMIRVTKPGGLIILVETVHTSWHELLKNAVLDKLLNERTNRELDCQIPVPLTFLSDDEINNVLQKLKIVILKESRFKPSASDPKIHKIYICRKI